MRTHYTEVQSLLLSEGLLRTVTSPPDAPFTGRNLAENFLRIAFFNEYTYGNDSMTHRASPIHLLRWDTPVRVSVVFGASVPPDRRSIDRASVASYFAKLASITGHQIEMTDQNPNFWVHFASVDELATLGPTLARELPEIATNQIGSATAMDANTYCQVFTQSDPLTSTYVAAAAVIPSEHPDLMRLMCINEELAQALGLPNDSNAARPSIFNDDEEFALLTRQDELMLRLLYNPALRPGMTEDEARPIVNTLATRLMGGES